MGTGPETKKGLTDFSVSPLVSIGSGGRIRPDDLWVMSEFLGKFATRWNRCNYRNRNSLREPRPEQHVPDVTHVFGLVLYTSLYTLMWYRGFYGPISILKDHPENTGVPNYSHGKVP